MPVVASDPRVCSTATADPADPAGYEPQLAEAEPDPDPEHDPTKRSSTRQPPRLEVDGELIPFAVAGFGTPVAKIESTPVVVAEPVLANTDLTNVAALKGNIAVVKRGKDPATGKRIPPFTCAWRAQEAGAVGVIIVHSKNTIRPVLFAGAGENESEAHRKQCAEVTIPSICVARRDGKRLLRGANNGPMATLAYNLIDPAQLAAQELGATFSPDVALSAAQRRATVTAVKVGTEECDHKYIQHFGGKFSCADCWAALKDVAPDRIVNEHRWLKQAQAEDAAIAVEHAEFSFRLGVTVAWILAFTNVHGCWDWETRDVQAFIIKPETETTRGRYVDLPHVRAHAGVGEADVFVSRESVLCSCASSLVQF